MRFMTALEYLKEKNRMTEKCTIPCSECPLCYENNGRNIGCGSFQMEYPMTAISIVENWAKNHPRKWYMKFL